MLAENRPLDLHSSQARDSVFDAESVGQVAAIILAAGKGKRMNAAGVNKVALPFLGKPMIQYGVDLFTSVASPVVVVVGTYAESVRDALSSYDVLYALQSEQLGTGHAVKIGLQALAEQPPAHCLIGYGDHMMFYRQDSLYRLMQQHVESRSAVSVFTTFVDNPSGYGRIVRDQNGRMIESVEQKEATPEQAAIKEINTCLYCVEYEFLREALEQAQPSAVTGEYYLTDIIGKAVEQDRTVIGLPIPFEEVGVGANTAEDLAAGSEIYIKRSP